MSVRDIFSRIRAKGKLSNAALVGIDAAIVVIATTLAYYARFEGAVPENFSQWAMPFTFVSIVVFCVLFAAAGLYRLVLRYVSLDTLLRLLGATFGGTTLLVLLNQGMPVADDMRPVPLGVLFIQGVLVFLGASAARLAARLAAHLRTTVAHPSDRRVLIVGAGDAGSLLLREIHNRRDLGLEVVGFLDDDPALRNRAVEGVPVLGTVDDLRAAVEEHGIDEIMVAMPSAPEERVRRLLNEAADAHVQARIVPQLVIAKGSVSVRDLRPVEVEDLLGREPTPIDVGEIADTLSGRVVAVTGAAGSIGSELCRQIATFAARELLLIETDETRLYELWLELERLRPGMSSMCLCDIRDARAIDRVFADRSPEVVLHAAAYKHVPVMEVSPAEAVKTNVAGTKLVVEASVRHGIERFVLISTDKAVAPVNVMGLTKALAERIVLDAVARSGLNAVAVRFGNVLGSRGSVVPIFEDQLRRGGPLTVTHPSATRYFMTIPEAARLVLQAQAIGSAGDIFVLEMGEPVRIADLAGKMIVLAGVPADIEYVGLRPGEKLHETLVNDCEHLEPTDRDKILRVAHAKRPGKEFPGLVEDLIRHAMEGDIAGMEAVVQRLEPGFAQRERRRP